MLLIIAIFSNSFAPYETDSASKAGIPRRSTITTLPNSNSSGAAGKKGAAAEPQVRTFGGSLADLVDDSVSSLPLFVSLSTAYLEMSGCVDLFIRSGDRTGVDSLKAYDLS